MKVVSREHYSRARRVCSVHLPQGNPLLPVPSQIECCGKLVAACNAPAREWEEMGYYTLSSHTAKDWTLDEHGLLVTGIKFCPWCGSELYYQWVWTHEDEKTRPS